MPFIFRFLLPLLLLTVLITPSNGQEKVYSRVDLQDRWLIWEDDGYRPFSPSKDEGTKVIYFRLKKEDNSRGLLEISSFYKKTIFVNGKLHAVVPNELVITVEELRTLFRQAELLIAVYQEHIHKGNLKTKFALEESQSPSLSGVDIPKPLTYFHDFVIVGTICLLVLLVGITQLTKLSLRYFSVKRIFSSYESDDTQLYTRVFSGSNILFYIFCSLVMSFYMVIIFHHVADQFIIAWSFNAGSFSDAWLKWGQLSLILLMIFMARILVIFVLSRLYNMREIFGFQIINWVRVLLIVFGLLGVVLMIYSISRGIRAEVYKTFYWLILFAMVGWCIILFMKVARRSAFSLFHIFSYLCVTEIIPLLVAVKFLFQ